MLRVLLRPRMLALHLAGVVAVTAAVLLGLWQYHAWETGRDLASRDLANARALPLNRVLSPDGVFPGDQVGRPVTFSGRWVPGATVTVTDRRLGGRIGVWAVTPVAVCAADQDCARSSAILVVRGWAPDRDAVPPPPRGRVDLTGWLQPGEGAGLPDPNPTDRVLPELRVASVIQFVHQDLYGGYVIARSGASSPGLERVTPAALPQPDNTTKLRNLLYAGEWWIFGGFAVFLWWRWARDEVDRAAAAEEAAAPEIPSLP